MLTRSMKAMGKSEKVRKEMKESKDDDEKDMSSKTFGLDSSINVHNNPLPRSIIVII